MARSQTDAVTPKTKAEQVLAKMLAIIKSHPGIRPSELNRRLNLEQSDSLRATLIRRGLVRKVKDGQATYLYVK
jgi:DNA-binding MarR family transcriptional regulator